MKKWYTITLFDGEEEIVLAKVNSKGLAYITLEAYKKVYNKEGQILKLQ